MLIFVHGDDDYRSTAYVRDQIAKFKTARDPGGYNTRVLNARETDGGTVLRELSAAPFLADRRMLVVKDVLSISDASFLETFNDLIEQNKIPESTVLLIWQVDTLGRSNAVKKLKAALLAAQFVQEFPALKDGALESWIVQETARRGGTMLADAARFLGANAHNMWEVSTTIDALIAYAAGEGITGDMVKLWVSPQTGETVFSLAEAVVAHDRAKALRALDERREAGDEDGQIFGMLVWQFRLMLALADFAARNPGAPSSAAAKEAGVHPFVAQKNWGLAQKTSRAALARDMDELVKIDRDFKTGAAALPVALERFIARA